MSLFRLAHIEFDVGEYSHERVLWIDILAKGQRFLSEPIQLDNQQRYKNAIEIARKSETTVMVYFNSQIHCNLPGYCHIVDVILRDGDGRGIASAFSVRSYEL